MEVKEEENKPCYILSIPNELQIMIFDKMEPADKISYGKSSRKCRQIWKNSKSFYVGIGWKKSGGKIRLTLNNSYPFTGNDNFIEFRRYFRDYTFGQTNGRTQSGQIKRGENVLEMAKKKFVEKLEKYQNTVKSITIKGKCPIDLQNIQSFPNLQYLDHTAFRKSEGFQEILSKSGNKLKYLKISIQDFDGLDVISYAEFQQVYQVREYLSIKFWLSREQMFNLSARKIEMVIGYLNPEDIFEFIRTWQNGTRILESCRWSYCFDFDAQTFFGFFNVQMRNDNYKRISIRGIGLTAAMITYNEHDETLSFEVIESPNLDENIDSDGDEDYEDPNNDE